MSANIFDENKLNKKDYKENPLMQLINMLEDDNESIITNNENKNSISEIGYLSNQVGGLFGNINNSQGNKLFANNNNESNSLFGNRENQTMGKIVNNQ